jgi:TolB protein
VIVCKVCGHANEAGAQFCGSCGGFLEWSGEQVDQPAPPGPPETGSGADEGTETVVVPPPPPPPPPDGLVCPACGTVNERDRVYCRRCATELAPVAPPPPPPPAPARSGLTLPPASVLGVAALAVLAIGVLVVLGNLLGGGGDGDGGTPSASPDRSPTAPTASPSAALPSESAPPSAVVTEPPGPTGLIAFSSTIDGNADIAFAAPDGSGLGRLTNLRGNQVQPAWSRDGSRLAFAADDGIWIIDANGGNLVRFTDGGGGLDRKPEWSPDDSIIAFARRTGGDYELLIQEVAGGDPVRLTDNAVDDYDPSWSAAPDRIAFVSGRAGTNDIWTMRPNGTDLVQLTGDEGREDDPAWSPDGTTIAFASTREGTFFIYLMDADGTNVRRLSSGAAVEHDATWSPDGRYIAFHRAGAQTTIVVVDASDGRQLASFAEANGSAAFPTWK